MSNESQSEALLLVDVEQLDPDRRLVEAASSIAGEIAAATFDDKMLFLTAGRRDEMSVRGTCELDRIAGVAVNLARAVIDRCATEPDPRERETEDGFDAEWQPEKLRAGESPPSSLDRKLSDRERDIIAAKMVGAFNSMLDADAAAILTDSLDVPFLMLGAVNRMLEAAGLRKIAAISRQISGKSLYSGFTVYREPIIPKRTNLDRSPILVETSRLVFVDANGETVENSDS